MTRSEEILNEIRAVKSKMKHSWDEVLVVDLNEIGLWPTLKNQSVKITYDNCDKDKIAELFLKRLSEIEPMFKKISPEFKEQFKMNCARCFCNQYFNERKQENSFLFNWTEFFDQFCARISFNYGGIVYWENPNDLSLWNKIDISKSIKENLCAELGDDYKKELEKVLKEEDPAFFNKIVKHQNSVNPKAS